MYNGEKIKDLLRERHIKASALSEYIYGDSRRSLHKFIKGNPTVSHIEKIADFFQVPIDVFFDREIVFQKPAPEPAKPNGIDQVDQMMKLVSLQTEIIGADKEYIKTLLEENERLREENAQLKK